MENIKQQMEEVRQLGEELKESFIKSIEIICIFALWIVMNVSITGRNN